MGRETICGLVVPDITLSSNIACLQRSLLAALRGSLVVTRLRRLAPFL